MLRSQSLVSSEVLPTKSVRWLLAYSCIGLSVVMFCNEMFYSASYVEQYPKWTEAPLINQPVTQSSLPRSNCQLISSSPCQQRFSICHQNFFGFLTEVKVCVINIINILQNLWYVAFLNVSVLLHLVVWKNEHERYASIYLCSFRRIFRKTLHTSKNKLSFVLNQHYKEWNSYFVFRIDLKYHDDQRQLILFRTVMKVNF